MWIQIMNYFQSSSDRFFNMLLTHAKISLISLVAAFIIGIPAGYLCVRYEKVQKYIVGLFGTLRVIPSLAILLLMIPLIGTGTTPAVAALVLLAIPPILTNTVTGLEMVPDFMIETARGMGMEEKQVWRNVRFPLAMPMIMAGIKTAAVEIVASATLASKIGAGGLGDIIFTGMGLFRTDLLLIGGVSVACMSLLTGLLFSSLEKIIMKHRRI